MTHDDSSLSTPRPPLEPATSLDRKGWIALLVIAIGVGTVIMDATVVNVALPVVIDDLNLTAADAQWINAAYSLVFAALLLTLGRMGDLHGRKRLFITGMLVFVLASGVAGLSTGGTMLIAARLIQGLGAAMIVPSTLSTINAMFAERSRTIAFAVWGSAIGGMAAVGPLVGGWLATDASWRWAFWLNIPIGVLVLGGALRAIPETRDPSASPGRDVAGVLMSAIGMGAIVFALIEGQWFGWWRQDNGNISPVPIALAAGIALVAGFIIVERRRRQGVKHVLVDLRLFSITSFRTGIIAALIVAFGEFGLLFTLPLLLQGTLGYSALGTGGVITALAIGTFVASGVLPQLRARMSQRAIVRAGLLLEALAVGSLAAVLTLDISTFTLCALLFVYGAGVGWATAQLTSLLLFDVPVGQSGQASGLQSAVRQLGSALGVAVLGGFLVGRLGAETAQGLTALPIPDAAADSITTAVQESAGIAIASLQTDPTASAVADVASTAMIEASRWTLGIAAALLMLGFLATLFLPRQVDDAPNVDSAVSR